jgi:predicted PurR-regulated permease PerM
MATVSAAANRVEEMTSMPDDRETVVVQSRPLSEIALSQTRGFLAGLVITLSLLYFMLAAGDRLLTRVAWLVRNGREPDGDLALATQIRHNVSRYLLTSVAINIGLGIAVGTAMFFIGVPNPVLWGVVATLLNFIPYLGGIAGVVMIAIAALSTIDEPGRALLAPAAYAILNTLEGVLVTPAVVGKRMQLNPIAVFIFIMFSGWLWGIVGTLIAVPVLTSIKVVSDAHPRLAGLSAFLAR